MEWINVENRLPELEKDVLTWSKSRDGMAFKEGECYFAIDRLVSWEGEIESFVGQYLGYGTVTHWVEIEPPVAD